MDAAERQLQLAEAFGAAQVFRQRVVQVFCQRQDSLDIAAQPLLGEPCRKGINRNQPPGFGGEYLGGIHFPAQQGAAQPAVKKVFFAHLQGLSGVFGVKKGDGNIGGIVGGNELINAQPLTDALFPRAGDHQQPQCRGLARRGRKGGEGLAGVDVGTGQVVKQVADGGNAQLMVEGSPFFPHAFEIPDIVIKADGHGPAPFLLKRQHHPPVRLAERLTFNQGVCSLSLL